MNSIRSSRSYLDRRYGIPVFLFTFGKEAPRTTRLCRGNGRILVQIHSLDDRGWRQGSCVGAGSFQWIRRDISARERGRGGRAVQGEFTSGIMDGLDLIGSDFPRRLLASMLLLQTYCIQWIVGLLVIQYRIQVVVSLSQIIFGLLCTNMRGPGDV